MLSDPNAGMQLYFQGKLRVSGDPMLAMKLQEVFKLVRVIKGVTVTLLIRSPEIDFSIRDF